MQYLCAAVGAPLFCGSVIGEPLQFGRSSIVTHFPFCEWYLVLTRFSELAVLSFSVYFVMLCI